MQVHKWGLFVIFMVISLALCAVQGSAWAHAILVYSAPEDRAVLSAAPDRILLRFNARIEKSLSSVKLFRNDGRSYPVRIISIEKGAAAEPGSLVVGLPELGPGSYTLRYNVLATDGHLTPGVLRFSIVKGK